MRLLSNLHVKGKPAVLPDRAIRRQSLYFIYRPRILLSQVYCVWQVVKTPTLIFNNPVYCTGMVERHVATFVIRFHVGPKTRQSFTVSKLRSC